jgi:hypothetical protein
MALKHLKSAVSSLLIVVTGVFLLKMCEVHAATENATAHAPPLVAKFACLAVRG